MIDPGRRRPRQQASGEETASFMRNYVPPRRDVTTPLSISMGCRHAAGFLEATSGLAACSRPVDQRGQAAEGIARRRPHAPARRRPSASRAWVVYVTRRRRGPSSIRGFTFGEAIGRDQSSITSREGPTWRPRGLPSSSSASFFFARTTWSHKAAGQRRRRLGPRNPWRGRR